MNIISLSHTGLVRKNNQDNYLVKQNADKSVTLLMVLDGVGGSNAGEVASGTVASLFSAYFEGIVTRKTLDDYRVWVVKVLDEINTELYRLSHLDNEFKGMSTTCVCALFCPLGAFYINVGDSRIYMVDHRDELVQLSSDHSLVNDLLVKGTITMEQAKTHPMRHAVTNAMGIYENFRCDYQEIQMPYKSILLCTDGLSGYVEHDLIKEILVSDQTLEDKKNQLNQAVNDAGAVDNYTFIIMEV